MQQREKIPVWLKLKRDRNCLQLPKIKDVISFKVEKDKRYKNEMRKRDGFIHFYVARER